MIPEFPVTGLHEGSRTPRSRDARLVVLMAGVVATALTWGAGEAALGQFQPKATGNLAMGPLHGSIAPEETNRTEVKNAALAYGLQGAILGLMLGLAGAAARGSVRAAFPAGLTGLLVGGMGGAGAARGLLSILQQVVERDPGQMLPPLLMHAGVCALIGASAGLAFGLGMGGGRVPRAVIGGLVGAVLGAVVYQVIGALFLPLAETYRPLASTGTARFLAHASVNNFIAVLVALTAAGRP